MNERKYACQSVVEINNGKFKKDGEITQWTRDHQLNVDIAFPLNVYFRFRIHQE